jgi:hypothetical protein
MGTENIFTAEFRKILKYKEELLTDVKNMLYHRTDNVERLQKVVTDTEEQFADYLRQIKTLGDEKGRREKELEILREVAQTLVDMVDLAEAGEADKRPLLERLRGASEKVIKFLAEAPVACVSHALAFVKSFWLEAPLGMFAQGVAAECTEEQFNDYLQEAQPVAEQVVQSVVQD